MRIAVIRFNTQDNMHVVETMHELGYIFIDVFLKDHIHIETLDNEETIEVFLKGIDIKSFDRILFFNVPDEIDFYLKSEEDKYVSTESFTALIAALNQLEPALINGYDAFSFNQLLTKPSVQIVNLNEMDWRTPTVSTRFNLEEKKMLQFKEPNPDKYLKYYFIASQKRYMVFPGDELPESDTQKFPDLFTKSAAFLNKKQMDWLVIPFIIHEHQYFAYGLTSKIPYHLDKESLKTFVKDILS